MSKISIVTAFYDIGRGGWTVDKGLPHFLERSNQTYIDRFKTLTKLDNDITVFTSPDLVPLLKEETKDRENVTVIPYDLLEVNKDDLNKVSKIQKSESFRSRVNPRQILMPEYWSPHYVVVTNLKAHFVQMAIDMGIIKNDTVSWIDFGYCRLPNQIPKNHVWEYNFDPQYIHLFNYKTLKPENTVQDAVLNNDVYILGAKAVAHKNRWKKMCELMEKSKDLLAEEGLVDDDQGLWLMSTVLSPDDFKLHKIPDHQLGYNPFVLFNLFNDKA